MSVSERALVQANFVLDMSAAPLCTPRASRVRDITLDTIGCLLVGADLGGLPSSDLVTPLGSTRAILRTELYEGNRFARGHPAVHIIPSLLFDPMFADINGECYLRSLAAGYEIASRWGSAVTLASESLGHGMLMSVGATAAFISAYPDSIDASVAAEALKLAATLPEPSVWACVWEDGGLHDVYPALGARQALGAVELARSGIRCPDAVLKSAWEDLLGASISEPLLTDGLGEVWDLERGYFKVHSGCRFVNMYSDMLCDLMGKGLSAGDVKCVEVRAYAKASRLNRNNPVSRVMIQFSLPCSLAVQLEEGVLTPRLIERHVNDERTRELASRIQVIHDDSLDSLLPSIRAGVLTVTTQSGTKLVKRADHAIGDFDGPTAFGSGEVRAKFEQLVGGLVSKDCVRDLERDVYQLGFGVPNDFSLLRANIHRALSEVTRRRGEREGSLGQIPTVG